MEQTITLPAQRKVPVSNRMLGMIFLLTTEIMFFGGLISAYIINRAGAGIWPPPGQPRLGVEITALNTFVLITSAVLLFLSNVLLEENKKAKSKKLLIYSILAGTLFLVIQGSEWFSLLSYGLTTSSGLYGAFFYTIIGAHALHVVVGLILLGFAYRIIGVKSSANAEESLKSLSLYWYFVSGIWPVLYYLVYLY